MRPGSAPTSEIGQTRQPTVVRAVRVEVISGLDVGASARSADAPLTVGTAEGAHLTLTDPSVSRYHLECEPLRDAVLLRDLGSTNGTSLRSMRVREVLITEPTELSLGHTVVRVTPEAPRALSVPPSAASSFGRLLGASEAMQAVYATLERCAPTSVPVLVTGESGTGKELVARSLHEASPRASKPFEIVDCGGLPPTLIEAELFGHERGAYSGAVGEREGAFERANGGTVFLDELGELPLEVQPKLLRALGEGEVRRLGGSKVRKVDVRVIAATNRDLRVEVNAKRFRADLFYRLAVIRVRMPPLRDRLDDLPILVPALLSRIGRERGVAQAVEASDELYERLSRYAWPGNVRELRNYLEQWAVLRQPLPPGEGEEATGAGPSDGDDALFGQYLTMPLREAKLLMLERFEQAYLRLMLDQTGGNVAEAARRAGVARRTLFRTIRRVGLRDEAEGDED
ncbi:MAG: sigma 54-interacting transcriptional regulator [Polyangiales bacterium]